MEYFVSYSRLDIAIVKNIVSQIELILGRHVWIDYTGIETADDFREKIIRAIESCDRIIFMLSSNSMESKFARKEVVYAKNLGKKVVPICIDETKLYGWFLFEFGEIDHIVYAKRDQREKFFKNIIKWENIPYDAVLIEKVLNLNFANSNYNTIINQDPAGRDLREVGDDHFYGRNGNVIDVEKAFMFYEQAANLGDVRSINYLGNYFYNGICNIIDFSKAFNYYSKAADLGYAPAQNNLGNCYYEGKGIEKDYLQAFKWYKLATEQNHIQAMTSLAECYYLGNGVVQDYEKSFELFTKAANEGNIDAMVFLGDFYFNGEFVNRDLFKAFEYYEKAAIMGNSNAQFSLGLCYKKGLGTILDKNQAIYWFEKASAQNNEEATKELIKVNKRKV